MDTKKRDNEGKKKIEECSTVHYMETNKEQKKEKGNSKKEGLDKSKGEQKKGSKYTE